MLRPFSLLVTALALAIGGCDGYADDDFSPELVVSTFLGAGEPMEAISLTETSPFLSPYLPEAVVLQGADVTISLLAPDGSVDTTYRALETDPGRYVPGGRPTVLAGRTYRLDVSAGDRQLTATTTVPIAVDLVDAPEPQVTYGDGAGPAVRVTKSSTVGRQSTFVGSTRALNPSDFETVMVDGETRYRSIPGTGSFPTPIFRRFLGCEDEANGTLLCTEDPRGEDIVIGTSPVINEASYIDLGDGTIVVEIPFIAFGYFGPYRLTLVALDPVLQAFVQTQAVQLGGTTLSPGEIPNVTTNVEGGLGVFGSFARVSVETTILEP